MAKLRSRRLLWQIYPVFILVIVLAVVAIGWYFSAVLKNFHHQDSVQALRARAELIALQVKDRLHLDERDFINDLCRQAGVRTDTRITIMLPGGEVLGDTREDPKRMENHGSRPEVLVALEGGIGKSQRFSRTLQKEMMYLAVPVVTDSRIAGVVRTAMAVDEVDSRLGALRKQVMVGGIVAIVLVSILSLLISRRITRPLEQIKQEAERYASGQLEHRLRISGSSEIVALGQTMNDMAAQLNERISTIDKQRREQDAVLSSMIEGVIAIDSKQNILRMNPAAAHLLEVNAELVVGRPVQEVVRKAELLSFITDAMDSEDTIEKDVLLFRGEEELCLQAHGTMLRGMGNETIGALVVFNDLTRQRRLETMRRDFVANVSHELKTPITAIKGFVETLLDGALDNRDEAEQFLKIVERQVERLSVIIEDLMSLSRIEQGEENERFDLEPGSIAEVISESVNDCTVLAEGVGITLKQELDHEVMSLLNGPLLEQALTNLLENAIKYSPTGSTVTICCSEENGRAIIRVSDQGCGIEAEHLPRLFERFYRVDKARSRQAGGSGLGLAIVKHIVQIHHGRVAVESTPGKGSEFIVSLPLA
jgi:two-component system phosphate regulon sensor histidine kinase PhoR